MKKKKAHLITVCAISAAVLFSSLLHLGAASLSSHQAALPSAKTTDADEPIKWVDFDIPYEVMRRAMDIDIDSYGAKIHVDWVDILAYLGAKYGGIFDYYDDADMDAFVEKVKKGSSVASLTKDMKYFNYYSRAYGAVLDGFLGEYSLKIDDEKTGRSIWKKVYGLKAFSPIAEGFYYTDSDDFGNSRSYGYDRRHLGHDMMASVGTPVIAVESGTVEALGWNQYGGWRIGIRSHDNLRYYYYAHLQKDHPYAEDLRIGASVTAGDIIGYTGQTGYSIKENVNNIETPHLHFGLQLVFDEAAKDSPTQIWIDLYDITRLLSAHRCTVVRNEETGTFQRKYPFIEETSVLQ